MKHLKLYEEYSLILNEGIFDNKIDLFYINKLQKLAKENGFEEIKENDPNVICHWQKSPDYYVTVIKTDAKKQHYKEYGYLGSLGIGHSNRNYQVCVKKKDQSSCSTDLPTFFRVKFRGYYNKTTAQWFFDENAESHNLE